MRFELRLQNGSKLFPIGMGWHQIIGEVGTATIRECPGFCRDLDLADCFAPHAKVGWSFWRLGDAARRELLDRASALRTAHAERCGPRCGVHLDRTSVEPTTRSESGRLSFRHTGRQRWSFYFRRMESDRCRGEARSEQRGLAAAQSCRRQLSRFRPRRVQSRQTSRHNRYRAGSPPERDSVRWR